MDFRGNVLTLIEVISGIMLLIIILVGEPTELHYGLLAGDIIALGFEIADRIRNKYF